MSPCTIIFIMFVSVDAANGVISPSLSSMSATSPRRTVIDNWQLRIEVNGLYKAACRMT